jgi:hypothetical protein
LRCPFKHRFLSCRFEKKARNSFTGSFFPRFQRLNSLQKPSCAHNRLFTAFALEFASLRFQPLRIPVAGLKERASPFHPLVHFPAPPLREKPRRFRVFSCLTTLALWFFTGHPFGLLASLPIFIRKSLANRLRYVFVPNTKRPVTRTSDARFGGRSQKPAVL